MRRNARSNRRWYARIMGKSMIPGAGVVAPAWERFLRFAFIEDAAACWRWRGGLDKDGYGNFHNGIRYIRAHRYAYEELIEPIPEGLVTDHLCRVRNCVNPYHLELVTHRENIRRGNVGKRERSKKTCPRGHVFDTITSEGKRRCSICHASTQRRYMERKRNAS